MNLIYSKWYDLGEKLFNLIIINCLIIVTALPIVTIFNAFVSGYVTIYEMRHTENGHVVKTFLGAYKAHFTKSVGLNILFLMWLIILMGIGRDVFMQNEFWLKVIFIVLSTEILMTLVGAMTQIKKSVKFITLIKTGFIHFHLHWLNYLLCGVLSVGFLMVAKSVKPIMFSATLYMLQVVLELMSRKVEGDIPINFLNVFEKTI